MGLDQFFMETAAAFAAGDFEAAAATLATPAVIHVGQQQIVVKDQQSVIDVLRAYWANLRVESYAKTVCTIQHVSRPCEDRFQVFVTWRNLNDAGGVISSFDAAYIVCETGDGRFQCITAEIMPPVKERLTAGLPLV